MQKRYYEFEKSKSLLPFVIVLVAAVATALTYLLTAESVKTYYFVEIFVMATVPALIAVISGHTPVKVPFWLNVAVSVHIILAVYMGTVLDFYHIVPCWDLILHGYFGFWGAWLVYSLFDLCGTEAMNRFAKFFFVFIGVMGLAALWEIGEFLTDLIFGSDAQRVFECIANGVSPVQDTMTDLIIAIVGVGVFFILLIVKDVVRRRKSSGADK